MTAAVDAKRWLLIASYGSVGVAILLIVVKAAAWFYTGSASLLGSLLDSVMDSMASVITMLAIRYSLKPADDDHRFGHGKAESLAALAQAGFIFASAALLLLYCAGQLFSPESHRVEHVGVGLWVMVFSVVITLALVAVQGYVIRMTGSTAISADRLHYKSDLFMNMSVILALVLARQGVPQVDIWLGIFIAFYVCRGAFEIGWDAFGMLMDKELAPEVDRRICELALSHEGVLGVHDLRTRRSGMSYVIQMHLEMADDTPLLQAHGIADTVEAALLLEFPGADVIIHQDPQSAVELEQKQTHQFAG